MPDAVVRHGYCAGLADHRHLPEEVLIASDVRLADAAVMTAGQEHGAAHLSRRVVGKVKELDVKVQSGVDDRVGMPDLPVLVVGINRMHGVVVVERVGPTKL